MIAAADCVTLGCRPLGRHSSSSHRLARYVSRDLEITNLQQLLDRLDQAGNEQGEVSVGAILGAVGHRSFGPLLLVAGLITLAPIVGDIPGIPTIVGVSVFLIAGQLLFRREHVWLPTWLLDRSLTCDKLRKLLKWLRGPARFIDRLLRPRLEMFTQPAAIAIACIIIAAGMPAMEFIPFSANAAGAALTGFGLPLIARDGLPALLAFTITAGALLLVLYNML